MREVPFNTEPGGCCSVLDLNSQGGVSRRGAGGLGGGRGVKVHLCVKRISPAPPPAVPCSMHAVAFDGQKKGASELQSNSFCTTTGYNRKNRNMVAMIRPCCQEMYIFLSTNACDIDATCLLHLTVRKDRSIVSLQDGLHQRRPAELIHPLLSRPVAENSVEEKALGGLPRIGSRVAHNNLSPVFLCLGNSAS